MDLALAVGLLHAAAFSLGYFLSRGLKFDEKTARTVSIETGGSLQASAMNRCVRRRLRESEMERLFAGMQSAALGFLLAQKHFVDPMVAVPSAVSVVFMALGGAALAVFWRNRPVKVLQ